MKQILLCMQKLFEEYNLLNYCSLSIPSNVDNYELLVNYIKEYKDTQIYLFEDINNKLYIISKNQDYKNSYVFITINNIKNITFNIIINYIVNTGSHILFHLNRGVNHEINHEINHAMKHEINHAMNYQIKIYKYIHIHKHKDKIIDYLFNNNNDIKTNYFKSRYKKLALDANLYINLIRFENDWNNLSHFHKLIYKRIKINKYTHCDLYDLCLLGIQNDFIKYKFLVNKFKNIKFNNYILYYKKYLKKINNYKYIYYI